MTSPKPLSFLVKNAALDDAMSAVEEIERVQDDKPTTQTTGWRRMNVPPRCEECGRFVGFSDIAVGFASHKLIVPESLTTRETFETLCWRHKS